MATPRTDSDRLDDLIGAAQKQIALTQKQMAWLVKRAEDEQEQADKLAGLIENSLWKATFEMRFAATIYLLSTAAALVFAGYTVVNLLRG